jgi:ribonuclease VapC
MSYVFDASVLICILKQEGGCEKALELLEDEVYMSSLNLAEFFAWVYLHSTLKKSEILGFIQDLEIKVVDFDSNLAIRSGEMILKTKKVGLSLGDRACLATGENLGLQVITCDKVWKEVDTNIEVILLR